MKPKGFLHAMAHHRVDGFSRTTDRVETDRNTLTLRVRQSSCQSVSTNVTLAQWTALHPLLEDGLRPGTLRGATAVELVDEDREDAPALRRVDDD